MFSFLLSVPVMTTILGIILLYLILVIKKIIEEANQKTISTPNLQKLIKSLPLTLNTRWKLIDVVNGVPIWEDQSITENDSNGIIACQALIQATAEVTITQLFQPKILSLIQPSVDDATLIPILHRNQAASDIKNDLLSVNFTMSQVRSILDLFFLIKNNCNLHRNWKCNQEPITWLSIAPEYKIFANKFGNWQLYLACDLPNEVKDGPSNISLLTIFISPTNNNETILNHLKKDLTAQIISIREHMDSLYLSRILKMENRRISQTSTINSPQSMPKTSNDLKHNMRPDSIRKSPTYEGKEELGYVEDPAEVKDVASPSEKSNVEKIHKEQMENEKLLLAKKNILKYKSTLDEAFEMLMAVYDADETTPNWTYVGNKQGVDVYRMQGDATCASDCFKGTAEVKVPVSYAIQYVTDLDYKREWDDLFVGGNVIEDIDEVTKVTYMEYRQIWPTSARDFCSITATRHVKDNTYAMAAKGISHPLCPPVKGKQRAEVIVGGFIIEEVSDDPPLCKLTYVTRADLKGRIPSSLVNKVNDKQPMFAGLIRDRLYERFLCQNPYDEGESKLIAAKRHASIREKPMSIEIDKDFDDENLNQAESQEKTSSELTTKVKYETPSNAFHTPIDSDASSDHSSTASPVSNESIKNDSVKATTASKEKESLPGEANFRELSDAEVDALFSTEDKKWDSMSMSSVGSIDPEGSTFTDDSENMKPLAEQDLDLPRDHFGNLDFKTLANQSAASLLEEVLLVSKVDISKQDNVDINEPDVWTFQGIFRNVVVFRKIHKNSNIHSFLGRGIMQVIPLTVWEAIKNPATRFVYDNMLKRTKIIKDVDERIRVIHMRHETTACFVKQARDFIVLLGERVEQGKYILSGTSVSLPECPIEKNCVRGKVLASGWTIEPVLHHGKPCSLVTYLSQVDFGGRLPIRLINHVAKRQPMSIAYLRKYLEEAEHRK